MCARRDKGRDPLRGSAEWSPSDRRDRLASALLVLKGGREIDRIVGAQPKSEIVRRL